MNRRLVLLLLAAALIDVCQSDAPRTTEGGGGRKLRRRNDAAPARHGVADGDVGARLLKGGKEGKEKGWKGKKETKTHVDDTKGGDKMEKKKKGDAAEKTDKNAEKADAGNDKDEKDNNNKVKNKIVKNKNGGDVACDESLAGGSDVTGTSHYSCTKSSDCVTGCCLTFPVVSMTGACVKKCDLAVPIALHGKGQRCSSL